jgi:hypothetical protein
MSNRILVISDLHAPFYHPDTVPFLEAIKNKYDPDKVICVGDEVDGNAISFHDKDPDMPFSPSSELEKAIGHLVPIFSMFPKVKVMESNHGSLVYRRAKHAGIPRRCIKSYQEILTSPKGWTWHDELVITLPNKQKCYFSHGQSGKAFKVSKDMCMNAVQGHWHNDFSINYWSNPESLFWSMSVGCMIDEKNLAFEYGRLIKKRPLIGVGMIIDSQPRLIPLVKNKKGRWIKKLF